jgi:hypothetical protein
MLVTLTYAENAGAVLVGVEPTDLMNRHLRRLVVGTPLEPLARRLLRKPAPDDRGSRYDRQTTEVMRRVLNRRSSCVDIGAFRGLFLGQMLELAPEGHHFAFEPLPHLASELQSRFPAAEVVQVALSDERGQLAFRRVLENEGYSGFF